MKLSDAQIAARVSTGVYFSEWRRKIHRLRRLTAGDISALDEWGSRSTSREENMATLANGARSSDLYDILVMDVEEGRSNDLLNAVRTLMLQVSLQFPDVEFEDLDSDLAAVNSAYIKDRAKRCALRKHRRLSLADYLISGLGCTFTGLRDGLPFTEFVDALDFVWDLTAQTFDDMRWASRTVRRPLGEWLDDLDAKAGSKMLKALGRERKKSLHEDEPIAVACYYDVIGEKGNEAKFVMTGEDKVTEEDLIERVANPYADYTSGQRQVIVPFNVTTYLSMPSVRNPIGAVEQMLPAQIAVWKTDRLIQDSLDLGTSAREMEEGAYTPESLEAWKEDPTTILVRYQGKQPMIQSPPQDVPPETMAYRNMNESAIVKQSGANPYASGAPVKGTRYAAEVNAIQGSAGLVAGAIAKDEAAAWVVDVQRMLAVGKDYDDEPLLVRLRDGDEVLEIQFDQSNPIRDYLRPDAQIVVAEDGLMYKPRDQKMAMAAADVEMGMSLAALFPNFVKKAAEDYLRAAGKRNIGEYLEAPAPMPMPDPAMQGGGMPMEDSAQDAMSSTAGI